jgi:protease IV
MKQFLKFFLASLLALLAFCFLGFLFLIGIAASSGSNDDVSISKNSFITIDMSKDFAEQTSTKKFSIQGSESGKSGLQDMIDAIAQAKTDVKIKGIYIKMKMGTHGWASLYDLRNALIDFKTSGKKIIAYGELVDQKCLYLSSAADSVFANPLGAVEFKGLAATGTFYKKAMDKLEITPTIFYCGKFKGASEPYRLEKFSEPNKLQINNLLTDFYSEFLNAISSKTKIDTNTLKSLANNLSIRQPQDAVKANLIDGLRYENEVLNSIKNIAGIDIKNDAKFASIVSYIKTLKLDETNNNKVAILFAEGEISDGKSNGKEGIYSATIIENIRAIAANDKIKALVLRINSPGGSALASENIYHELMLLKQKKPIIVSMGNVAASGGYYMSCAGDSVFAQPTTITGSIGVVGMMLSFEKFLSNKIGVTQDVIKTSPHADLPSVTRTMTPDEIAMVQSTVDSIYITFKNRVSNARGLSMQAVEDLAQGHVYAGKAAQTLKLVDRMGSLNDAIKSAAAKVKLTEYKLVKYPIVEDGLAVMIKQLTGEQEEAKLKSLLGVDYELYKKVQALRNNTNTIQAIAPWELEIK